MMVGSVLTAPVTIAINIVDPASAAAAAAEDNSKKGKKNKKKRQSTENHDIERGSIAGDSMGNSGSKSPSKSRNSSQYRNDEVDIEMVGYEESKHQAKRSSSGPLFNSMTRKSTSKTDEHDDL